MRNIKGVTLLSWPPKKNLPVFVSSQGLHVYSTYNGIGPRRGKPPNAIKANDL